MAGTHLVFTLLMLAGLEGIQANLNPHGGAINAKPFLDPKRRSQIVDETFLEQKDLLLEMLETKLKEVREKRKNKALNSVDGNNTNNVRENYDKPIDKLLENIDLKVDVNGISAIGDTNLELKYGPGKGLVNMDAQGISNIGELHVELGVGETGFFIPGLTGLLTDRGHSKNMKINATSTEAPTTEKADNSRRSGNNANLNETTAKVVVTFTTATITRKHHTMIIDSANALKNSTVQVWNTPDEQPLVTSNSTVTVTGNSTV